MNSRKTTTFSLVTAAFLIIFTVAGVAAYHNGLFNSSNGLKIEITKKTSQQEVDALVKDLKAQGITLEINELEYNHRGHITKIEGTIDLHDGHSGGFSSGVMFSKVTITRNFRPLAGGAFSIRVN